MHPPRSSRVPRSIKIVAVSGLLLLATSAVSSLVGRGAADPAEPDPNASRAPDENSEAARPFEDGVVIVQFQADVVRATRSSLQPGEHLASRLAALPEVAALNQALNVRSMSPALVSSRRSGAQRSVPPEREWMDRYYLVEFDADEDVLEVVRRYERLPGVATAQPSYVYTPDQSGCGDPCHPNDGLRYDFGQYLTSHQWTDAESGWAIETGDAGIVIAILGLGIEHTHEDLAANMWINEPEAAFPNNV